jgi:hypothetical protein
MENSRVDELRAEVSRLLKKQSEVLESRAFGAATDTEILEIRDSAGSDSGNLQSTRQRHFGVAAIPPRAFRRSRG